MWSDHALYELDIDALYAMYNELKVTLKQHQITPFRGYTDGTRTFVR